VPRSGTTTRGKRDPVDLAEQIRAMRAEMFAAAESLDFERAARLRDELKKMEALAGKDLDAAVFYDPYADAPKKAGRASPKARAKASGARGRYKR
jgi:excinuclease ABC subunit B